RGEKRADDVDLWSHHPPILWPRTLVLRRVAGCEGQRSGGIHELELRVDLDEPGTAQLAARSQEVGQGAETMAIGLEGGLIRLLGGSHESSGDVKPTNGEVDIRIGFPHVADGTVAGGRHFVLGSASLGLRQLHPSPPRATLEDIPLEVQPNAVAG